MEKTEKVSVNMNIGTLSQIDLLVDQGFYSNRSDFINQAVREALNQKQDRIKEASADHDKWNFIWFLGLRKIQMGELQQIKDQNNTKVISGYGILQIDEALDDLLIETITKIDVKGKVICSDRIRKLYGIE